MSRRLGHLRGLGRHPPQATSGDVSGREPHPWTGQVNEAPKAEAMVNVIYHGHTTWWHGRPGRLQLEVQVACRVQAVVDEEMELLELGQQVWEPLTTCSMDIRPTVPQVLWDGDTDLAMQGRIDRREIDAPQMTAPIALQSLKNDSTRDPVSDASLDHSYRAPMGDDAPNGLGERSVAVVPPAVRGPPNMNTRIGKLSDETVPYPTERCRSLARPRHVERRMQAGLPIRDRSVEVAHRNPECGQLPLVPAPVDTPSNAFHSLPGMTQHGLRCSHCVAKPHWRRLSSHQGH